MATATRPSPVLPRLSQLPRSRFSKFGERPLRPLPALSRGLFIWFISLSTRPAVWTPRPCQSMVLAINPVEGLESHPEYAEIRCKERGRSTYPTDGVGSEPLLRLTRGDAGQQALRLFPPPASIHHFV